MKFLKKEEFIYMDCTMRMSSRAMADLLYAVIICQASIPTSFGVGIYECSRSQNAYNNAEVKIFIHPSVIEEFEATAKIKLRKPKSISIN